MRVYVAGPMTGLPDFNYPTFFAAAEELAARGHEPVNPARRWNGPAEPTWEDFMRRGLADVLSCTAVALLPGHENSKGARLEKHVAEQLGLDVRALEDWCA